MGQNSNDLAKSFLTFDAAASRNALCERSSPGVHPMAAIYSLSEWSHRLDGRVLQAEHCYLWDVERMIEAVIENTAAALQGYSQLAQDKFVLEMTGHRRNGTFLEIGSGDGVEFNNTLLLEESFDWVGVCVEPNPAFHDTLRRVRTAQIIEKAAYRTTGEVLPFIADDLFGTLMSHEGEDGHAERRSIFRNANGTINVETITVADVMQATGLPDLIDYLSLDTEGSEWDILGTIDLGKTRFGIMTIEHNYVEEKRKLIAERLASFGYMRICADFDDWFYNPASLIEMNGLQVVDFDAIVSRYMSSRGYARG